MLVVEDLHWADRSTRDLLAFLVRNLRRERVLLVVTYRNDEPGQQQLGPYLAELDRGGRVERLELARLDQAETGAQLVGILGAAPAAELVDAVFARSEGNPFFTEELLAVVRAGSGELPATLRDLLRGRSRRCPTRPGTCSRWSRWLVDGCPTGSWPRSPAWTIGSLTARCGRRSPASCW